MFATAFLLAGQALGASLEAPTRYDAVQLLGQKAHGVNYRVTSPVTGDGFLRNYNLETAYGNFSVRGDRLLHIRIRELQALAALKQHNGLETFGNGFARAVSAPFEFVGGMLTRPGETLDETANGVGQWFDQIESGMAHPDSNPDGTIASALGVSKVKRTLAYGLGVDPYTDFAPLAGRLTDLAQAGAAGEITVAAALTQVPGTAGLAASGVSTAGNVRALVRDKTAAQLFEMNRNELSRLGIGKKTISQFQKNRLFTPQDQTVIATVLKQLGGVANLDRFLARVAQAPNRSVAVFQISRIEHIAAYHRRVQPLRSFVMVKGFPFNRARDGRIIGIFPLDELAWTNTTAQLVRSVTEDLRRVGGFAGAEFRISGSMTPVAASNLEIYGWTPVQHTLP